MRRTAHHHRRAARPAELDEPERIVLLGQHAAGHDEIGPIEILLGQLFRIAVDEADVPVLRKQRRDGDQPERRRRAAGAPYVANRLQVPKRIRIEFGEHQQRIGGRPARHPAGSC
jgi:hypothetical protein